MSALSIILSFLTTIIIIRSSEAQNISKNTSSLPQVPTTASACLNSSNIEDVLSIAEKSGDQLAGASGITKYNMSCDTSRMLREAKTLLSLYQRYAAGKLAFVSGYNLDGSAYDSTGLKLPRTVYDSSSNSFQSPDKLDKTTQKYSLSGPKAGAIDDYKRDGTCLEGDTAKTCVARLKRLALDADIAVREKSVQLNDAIARLDQKSNFDTNTNSKIQSNRVLYNDPTKIGDATQKEFGVIRDFRRLTSNQVLELKKFIDNQKQVFFNSDPNAKQSLNVGSSVVSFGKAESNGGIKKLTVDYLENAGKAKSESSENFVEVSKENRDIALEKQAKEAAKKLENSYKADAVIVEKSAGDVEKNLSSKHSGDADLASVELLKAQMDGLESSYKQQTKNPNASLLTSSQAGTPTVNISLAPPLDSEGAKKQAEERKQKTPDQSLTDKIRKNLDPQSVATFQ